MKSTQVAKTVAVIALAGLFAGCSTWDRMDRGEGTAVGGVGGAVAGALVAGPVGAVVGGLGGAYVGHETTGKPVATSTTYRSSHSRTSDPSLVRSVQQALNDRGYNVGAADGQWGPITRDAVKRFQRDSGQSETGELPNSTLMALGIPMTRDDVATSMPKTY